MSESILSYLPPVIVIGALVIGGKWLLDNYITMDADCGCATCAGCKGAGKEEYESHEESSYPTVYDPAHDFLPRYRFPPETSWSKSYSPLDSHRSLDYQRATVVVDSGCTAEEVL